MSIRTTENYFFIFKSPLLFLYPLFFHFSLIFAKSQEERSREHEADLLNNALIVVKYKNAVKKGKRIP
jgi:hypothetical protein